MTDDSLIPRARQAGDARREAYARARLAERLDGANRNSSSTIPTGSTLILEGGIQVPGGHITVRDQGEITVVGEGRDRYNGTPITVTTSLANRQVIDSWTGNPVLRPGIFIDASNNPRDPANVASLFSRYGDDAELQSAVTSIDNTVEDWQSVLSADPAGASVSWSSVDRTMDPALQGRVLKSGSIGVDVDGGGGIQTYARIGMDITDPATQHVTVKADARAYGGQLGPPEGVKLAVNVQDYQWNSLERSWIRLDKAGILQLHSVKAGGGTVDVTHNGDGTLQLSGSAGVNVQGTFTVNGGPVTGAVTSVNGKTGAVVLDGTDIPAATTSAPGAMSAADKTTLNTLAAPIPSNTGFSYASGYQAYDPATFAVPGFYMDRGRVWLSGVLGTASASLTTTAGATYTVATLPVGYRPARDILISPTIGPTLPSNTFFYIRASGDIQWYSPTAITVAKNNFFISFETVSFRP